MALPFYSWSKTAASNATADSTVNWQEGQAPSSINDSARAMMASTAAYRDDTSGVLATGGTSTAYTLTSNQGFISKAAMNGAEIAFTIAVTNGASPTLNVDGLGADPITLDGSTPVPTGTLIANSIYTAMYYSSGTAWRLKDFYQLPFVVPVGAMVDYFGATAPSSNFVFPYGQAISRTTYSALFTLFSTTFGTGDGSTTFNIPDLRGRVVAGKDDMGGSAASRLTSTYFGGTATSLGAVGGLESHTLTTAQLASHSHTNSLTDPGHSHTYLADTGGALHSGGTNGGIQVSTNSSSSTTGITITNASAGSGDAHNNVPPTIIANKLLRII